jgi:hypothetical protein
MTNGRKVPDLAGTARQDPAESVAEEADAVPEGPDVGGLTDGPGDDPKAPPLAGR